MKSDQTIESAIGGYFELELPPPRVIPYPKALLFQSARAAFFALLKTGRPERVWMPRYICDSMITPLSRLDIECVFYGLNNRLEICDDLFLADGDWLLYVNYFGLCSRNVDNLLAEFDPSRIVLDNSQAFFSSPRDCLASIYSPRKFVGVPDGGLLVTRLPVSQPREVDRKSFLRSAHLLKRIDKDPETGYHDYRHAEETFGNFKEVQMSRLTQRLLASIDFEHVRQRRNENFNLLHSHLGHLNGLPLDLSSMDGPLCYPFYSEIPNVRRMLISHRVFVPCYWPDATFRLRPGDFEIGLVHKCAAIPCDQRYAEAEMKSVIKIIANHHEGRKQ